MRLKVLLTDDIQQLALFYGKVGERLRTTEVEAW
jgi:hypothetical protein